jgi:predicted ATPase
VRADLPSGTVTLLFTDVEGSTLLLHDLGVEQYAQALAEHRRTLRDAFGAQGGVEVDTQGDAFFVAFPTASGALQAAAEALEGLGAGAIRVRMGIHTGTPHLGEEGYVGVDVHRAARIAAIGHGGQVLISAATASILGTDGLRDLGEHRLKDLSAPERIYQLGDDDFPPLASLHQTNLPVPATPFLGREQELAAVFGLSSRDDVRLVTLTGTGGTGKTRLALQAAGELADRYPHGVWWVPLATLRDPELVLTTAGQVLGAKDSLSEHIGDKKLLLLFDNFEHLVESAADLADLLGSCPNLDLLITSREPLHLTGEQEYPVPPFVHEEAVGFFLARARAVRPDFRADDSVSEICRRLDDLPLALELAASRVKALSAGQILERLEQRLPLLARGARDLPERQRTLSATIEWSHELLQEDEQRLFARLAVFRGGCTLEAAERIADADLDTLQALVDKSLLRHSGERYWMLATIYEYAAGRLEQAGEAHDLRRRHADYFLAVAEQAAPSLRDEGFLGEGPWLDRLDPEHDNVRAAVDRLEAAGESELVLRLTAAFWQFWDARLHWREGRQRLERALKAAMRPSAARATALLGAAEFAIADGEPELGRGQAEEALELHRSLGEEWGTAEALLMLGIAAGDQGDFSAARECAEESGRLFIELGDDLRAFAAKFQLAGAFMNLGDRERAHALFEQCLRKARTLRQENMEAATLQVLAKFALDEDRLEDAVTLAQRSLRIRCEVGSRRLSIAEALFRCASALAFAGHVKTAARLFGWSLAIREELGAGLRPGFAAELERGRRAIRTRLDDAAFDEAWEHGRSLTVDEAVALALDPTD